MSSSATSPILLIEWLPPNIPVKEFWSVIIYDNQTRSMLQTDQQFPSVSSQAEGLMVNGKDLTSGSAFTVRSNHGST